MPRVYSIQDSRAYMGLPWKRCHHNLLTASAFSLASTHTNKARENVDRQNSTQRSFCCLFYHQESRLQHPSPPELRHFKTLPLDQAENQELHCRNGNSSPRSLRQSFHHHSQQARRLSVLFLLFSSSSHKFNSV